MSRYIAENLRQLVALRANFCCEYCQISEEASFFSFQIDHIISIKHGGKTTSTNLAYSCFPCNNAKGSDVGTVLLASRDFIRLFNPRIDIWQEHFLKENSVFTLNLKLAKQQLKF